MDKDRTDIFSSSLMLDGAFKYLFTCSDNHIVLLKDLIGTILDIPVPEIKNLTVLNGEIPPELQNGKLCRLDLLLNVNDSVVNIELQFGHAKSFIERSLYYAARVIDHSLCRGELYNEVPRLICINIVDFKLFEGRDYHSSFHLRNDKDNSLLTNALRLDFLELSKVPEIGEIGKNDRKAHWMSLFKIKREEDLAAMNDVDDPVIRGVIDELRRRNIKFEEWVLRMQFEKADRDRAMEIMEAKEEAEAKGRAAGLAEGMAAGLAKGKAEGIAEGKAEGIAEGRAEGKAEGEADTTASFVSMRYPDCPASVLDTIRGITDRETIQRTGRALLESQTLEGFMQASGLA